MSATPAPAPAPAPAKKSLSKVILVGVMGLFGGSATMYATAVFDKVVKPGKPVANFGAKVSGLDVTLDAKATGESGWWDFGDGSALEPFDPAKSSVTHTYAKPGTYTVKLTVRNFLMEENERAIPVDLGTGANTPSNLPPSITAMTVQPISPQSIAPATFKVVGQVANADKCVINSTAGHLEEAGLGIVEKLIVIDKPGNHAVDLIAMGPKGAPVKQTAYVTVAAPAAGTMQATVKVIDTGTKTERVPYMEQVVVAVPTQKGAARSFEKRLTAPAGYSLKDLQVSVAGAGVKAVEKVKVEVDKDGRTAKVVGDWVGGPENAAKAAGGSEVFLAVRGFGERVTVIPPAVLRETGNFSATGQLNLPLPKRAANISGGERHITVEVTEAQAIGTRVVLPAERIPPTGSLSRQIAGASRPMVMTATVVGDQVQLVLAAR